MKHYLKIAAFLILSHGVVLAQDGTVEIKRNSFGVASSVKFSGQNNRPFK